MDDKAAGFLRARGIRLIEGERIETGFDVRHGLVNDITRLGKAFLLTTHRLIYMEGKRRVRSALLRDVQYLETENQGKRWWALIVGIITLLLGGYLALAENEFLPLTGAAVCLSISSVFLLMFVFSGGTLIRTHIGDKEEKVPVAKAARRDAEEFSSIFFTRKSSA